MVEKEKLWVASFPDIFAAALYEEQWPTGQSRVEIGVLLYQHHSVMIEGFMGLGAFPVLQKHMLLH